MRHSIFIILALTICQVTFTQQQEIAGGYTSVPLSQFDNDSEGQAALQFGAQFLVNQGIENYVLPNTSTFNVSQVYSVETQVVAGTNYMFHVQISNKDNNTFNATYLVYSQASTNTFELLSTDYVYDDYSFTDDIEYQVDFTEGEYININQEDLTEQVLLADGYTQINVTQAQNDANLQQMLNFGVEYVVQQELQNGNLTAGNWTLDTLNSIYRMDNNYRFDATVTSTQALGGDTEDNEGISDVGIFYAELVFLVNQASDNSNSVTHYVIANQYAIA